MSDQSRTTLPAADKANPLLQNGNIRASAVLTVGSLVWKLLAYWEHVDFLLSIREEKFAMIFDFFESTGWFLLAAAGVLWFLGSRVKSSAEKTPLNWAFLTSCAAIAFLFGVLITVKSSGQVPNVIASWGGGPTSCNAVIDMSKLQTFRDNYRLFLICGIQDPRVDLLEDERILISTPFDIRPGGVQIVAEQSKKADDLKKLVGGLYYLWHAAVLLPVSINGDKIARLSDVEKLGGKILQPGLYR